MKKGFMRIISAILSIILLVNILDVNVLAANTHPNQGEEIIEQNNLDNEEIEMFGNTVVSEVIEEKEQAGDFQNTLSKLISTYGLFKISQSGTMHSSEDKWMDVNGVISATILDFDSDGADEMLVCYADPTEASKGYIQIIMNMYELFDGKEVLADSVTFKPWRTDNYPYDSIEMLQFCNSLFGINVVKVNGICYLMCEKHYVAQAFANGANQNYWAMVYQNNRLQYTGSFTQTAGGSIGFAYTGYEFKDGVLIDSKLYYNEIYSMGGYGEVPLYSDFGTAIKKFFKKFGILLTADVLYAYCGQLKTILSEDNDKTEIFTFTNELVNGNHSIPKFTATLNRTEISNTPSSPNDPSNPGSDETPKKVGVKSVKSTKRGRAVVTSSTTIAGNDGYQIQYKNKGIIRTISVKTSKRFVIKTLTGLKSGTKVQVRIRAYKKVGGKTIYGPYSNWKSTKVR